MDVPVQFFQSVIGIELAVAGALLWQLRYFESRENAPPSADDVPDARVRLGIAVVLAATLFLSLVAIADEGPTWAAQLVTIGLGVSIFPIMLRFLPPVAADPESPDRSSASITILGLVLYVAIIAGVVIYLGVG